MNLKKSAGLALALLVSHVARADTAFVLDSVARTLTRLDTETNFLVGTPLTFPTGTFPVHLAFSPSGGKAYVVDQNNRLYVVDAATNTIDGSPLVLAGTSPDQVAVSPDGTQVYVSDSGANTVETFNTATLASSGTMTVPGQAGALIFRNGAGGYVADLAGVSVTPFSHPGHLAGASTSVGSTGGTPAGIAVSADGTRLYVATVYDSSGTVSVLDTSSNAVIATIPVGSRPYGIALSPDGKALYVANNFDDSVSVIDTTTDAVVGSPIVVGHNPNSLFVTRDGKHLYVANQNGGSLSIVDLASKSVASTKVLGGNPSVVAVQPLSAAGHPAGDMTSEGGGAIPASVLLALTVVALGTRRRRNQDSLR